MEPTQVPQESLPTSTPTPAPKATPVLVAIIVTATPSPTPTPLPTSTPTPTPTAIPTRTPIPTATPTPTPKPIVVPTATPTATPTVTPTATPTPSTALDPSEIEHWILKFTNQARAANLLPFLEPESEISQIARDHSYSMAKEDNLSHFLGGKDPTDRALDAGYDCKADLGGGRYSYGLAENISMYPRVYLYLGSRPHEYAKSEEELAKKIVDSWMASKGHRANILDPSYKKIGVGVHLESGTTSSPIDVVAWSTQNFSSC